MQTINLCQQLSPEKVEYLTSCSIPACERRVYRYRVAKWHYRPLCSSHYFRLSKFGNPLSGPPIKPKKLPAMKYLPGMWSSLTKWVRKYGLRFKVVTCKRLGPDYRAVYIAVPANSCGPRAGSSTVMISAPTVACWERLGWTVTEESGDGWKIIAVNQLELNGDKLPRRKQKL